MCHVYADFTHMNSCRKEGTSTVRFLQHDQTRPTEAAGSRTYTGVKTALHGIDRVSRFAAVRISVSSSSSWKAADWTIAEKWKRYVGSSLLTEGS